MATWSELTDPVATGASLVWDAIPGLGPAANSHSIFTPQDAERTYAEFQKFVEDPGPAVIGAVPGASCMGAGYEYLFNFDRHVRKAGIRDQVPITWVTLSGVAGKLRPNGSVAPASPSGVKRASYRTAFRSDSTAPPISTSFTPRAASGNCGYRTAAWAT